jgi:anti-sigma B factor antagonist
VPPWSACAARPSARRTFDDERRRVTSFFVAATKRHVKLDRLRPGLAVVVPSGEIDSYTSPALRASIHEVTDDEEITHVVVDLSQTTFIDSSGLGVLLGALKRLRQRDARLYVVVTAEHGIRRVFEITDLDRVLDLHETLEDALRS